MMKLMRYKILAFVLSNTLLLNFAIAADTGGTNSGASLKLDNPLDPCSDLTCIANAIIDALFKIATPIVAIMVLIGGFQILTAGGDPEKFKTGRKTILYTVVGYAIIILAKGVVSIVQSLLGA